MLALWVASGATLALVVVLAAVLPWKLARGRAVGGAPVEELLALDPGPPVVAEQAVLVADRLAALDRALGEVRARLGQAPSASTAAQERQRVVDAAYGEPEVTDEVWESLAGLGERLDADSRAARAELRAARGRWAGLDRLPLSRRAEQARGVLAEADRLVREVLAAQDAEVRLAVLRIRRAVATGDLAAASVADEALDQVRRMESFAGLRREVDELLENLDLTTRADRMLHPRLAREREGTSAVRAEVAARPWTAAPDLL